MGVKATILIRVPLKDWEALGPGKPARLREGIQKVVEHPEILGDVVRQIAVQDRDEAEAEAEAFKSTTFSVAPSHVDIIDRIAKRLATTRNALVQMIMKGILAGVI